MVRLKDILQHERKKNFVGRQKEIALFEQLLQQEERSVYLLYIYGSGGQGKTTLLKQFADHCKDLSTPFIQLDGRYIEAQPDSFKQAFQLAAPFKGNDIFTAIEGHDGNVVLMIDTYEKLKLLDDWIRMEFLPELPGNILTVIAGRLPLSTNWKTDPGWQSIVKVLKLNELSDAESKQLLSRRNIPGEQIQQIISYTHGNPLALSIVADTFSQRSGGKFDLLDSPDIMKALLDQFVQEVPSPAHKAALELCALVYVTTEKIIEEVLGAQMAQELFNWLTTLTFIEKGQLGIYPHDLARDTIAMELHWRNPEWYRHLHVKAQQYFTTRLLKQKGDKQRELLFGLIFLHRMNPVVKSYFQETSSSWEDKIMKDNKDPIQWLELLGNHINEEVEPAKPAIAPIKTIHSEQLTEEKFINAVHDALKKINNPKKMVGNVLLKCQFVQRSSGNGSGEIDLALTLAEKLMKAVASLENSPKDGTLHRVLHRTFINPVGSQEQTADFLYMSFSTYRRQVRKAVQRVADMLWLEEVRNG